MSHHLSKEKMKIYILVTWSVSLQKHVPSRLMLQTFAAFDVMSHLLSIILCHNATKFITYNVTQNYLMAYSAIIKCNMSCSVTKKNIYIYIYIYINNMSCDERNKS